MSTQGVYPTISKTEVERLLSLYVRDPHALLGAHPTPRGVVVRAYRSDAARVELLVEEEGPREMVRVHAAGIFELLLEGRERLFPYRLRVTYPNGDAYTQRDPYAFLPTLTTFDEHLFNEGHHWRLYDKLGAHVRELGGVRGVAFAVWAPQADGVSVVGSFNSWDGRLHPMRKLGVSGIWELFVPDLEPGALYKYEIHRRGSLAFLKTDPYALYTEVPPATSSIVFEPSYQFTDDEWMSRRAESDYLRRPLNIYEVHLGSWRQIPEQGGRSLTYRETAPALAAYCKEMGFTHVEFLPLKGHPYGGSWGYQVANYYAPTARFGTPDDFRYLIDYLHREGLGVIMDWVPAHFPKDVWALGRFDGTALYEHADPRQGEHPEWGTYVFNYGRNEVRNFLVANALFWLRECHVDGLRVDAVASMLYLDYSRTEGRWVPNRYGGRENLEAVDFIRELNAVVHREAPGAMMIAEESTSWPLVTKGSDQGGLGFDFKWNMGWMHDTLKYFERDPFVRRYFHTNLTFGLTYAWSENFVLPFSHDEVVHMKGSMLNKMHGVRSQKFANLRTLYAYMWAHPGKKLLFMGGEIGQWREWADDRSLDWHLLDEPEHEGVRRLVRDLNHLVFNHPALYEADVEPRGFQWIDVDNALENVVAFARHAPQSDETIVCTCNFSAAPRAAYRLGLPAAGTYRLILNTDAPVYGGANSFEPADLKAEEVPHHGLPFSALLDLPPLTALWYVAPPTPAAEHNNAAESGAVHSTAPVAGDGALLSEMETASEPESEPDTSAAPVLKPKPSRRAAAKKPAIKKAPAEKPPATAGKETTKKAPDAGTPARQAPAGEPATQEALAPESSKKKTKAPAAKPGASSAVTDASNDAEEVSAKKAGAKRGSSKRDARGKSE